MNRRPSDIETQSANIRPAEWGHSGGTIRDYISGVVIKSTPEEVDAVQVFARRLVEDYGYSKEQIQTRPQFRVHARPSGGHPSFPVDIAVFRDATRNGENLYMIIECKSINRTDGIEQLQRYMDISAAELGVWFNGTDHQYLRKIVHRDGRRTYQELPNIPRFGQRVEDVGLFARKDLTKPSNLRALFRDIRNHLAGNTTGITRDEALAQEIINLLFCKIYDEVNTAPNDIITFRMGIEESADEVKKRVLSLFKQVKSEYSDVFSSRDDISLDDASIGYVVGELQPYTITETDRDAVGEAFEVFIGPALRGAEGQFFTPRNVVRMVIEMLAPKPGEMILDPACGSGGFLITALEHVWQEVATEGQEKGWTANQIERRKREVASKCFRGIDKDSFLAKVTKAYMAIVGDGRGGVFCENSLYAPEEWDDPRATYAIPLNQFDVVLTNPPFGKNIKVKGSAVLAQYELAHRWKRSNSNGEYQPTPELYSEKVPHVLFLERCLQFLKPGGRLGIVLPESILGNPSYQYVVTFLLTRTLVRAAVTLPESLFKTSGKGGTHTKVCVVVVENTKPTASEAGRELFLSSVEWCGHDSRGNPTLRRNALDEDEVLDEVPDVAPIYQGFKRGGLVSGSRLGFVLPIDEIQNKILVPTYYDPEVTVLLRDLTPTHNIIPMDSLVDQGIIEVTTGVEVGKMAYGTGQIPFIRTSDFSNWEIKADFKQGISNSLYEKYKSKADAQPMDILMVRDGTYLIGTTAIVMPSDVPMLFQSHIFRIRVVRPELLSPWLLFVALNAPVVQKQIRTKQFTQDIIDTIGKRFFELKLPIPKDPEVQEAVSTQAREIIQARAMLKDDAGLLPALLQRGEGSHGVLERIREIQIRSDAVIHRTRNS